jgi:hypothetical protein
MDALYFIKEAGLLDLFAGKIFVTYNLVTSTAGLRVMENRLTKHYRIISLAWSQRHCIMESKKGILEF